MFQWAVDGRSASSRRGFSRLMHRRERWLLYLLLSRYTPLQPKNDGDRVWSFRSSRSSTWPRYELYVEHCEPRYLSLRCCEITSPFSSLSPQHPKAQKQTSITRCPKKPAPVPAGARGGLQDPHGQEDASSWHQDQTQTSPDAGQGPAPGGHRGRGNGPRTPAARRPRGEKEWVFPSFQGDLEGLADICVLAWKHMWWQQSVCVCVCVCVCVWGGGLYSRAHWNMNKITTWSRRIS